MTAFLFTNCDGVDKCLNQVVVEIRMSRKLQGKVAFVAGATRGAGRAIAVELARAGAYVFATGRSSRISGKSEIGRPETIEETGDTMHAAGGEARFCQVTIFQGSMAPPIQMEQGPTAGVMLWRYRIRDSRRGKLDKGYRLLMVHSGRSSYART